MYVYDTQAAASHSEYLVDEMRYTAISPYIYDAFFDDYINLYWNDNSALPIGERLYTMEGSHSAGIGLYMANRLNVHIDKGEDHKSFHLVFRFWGNVTPIYKYKIKLAYLMQKSSSIRQGNKYGGGPHDITFSFPSALAYTSFFDAGRISQINIPDLFIRTKSGISDSQYKGLISDMRK